MSAAPSGSLVVVEDHVPDNDEAVKKVLWSQLAAEVAPFFAEEPRRGPAIAAFLLGQDLFDRYFEGQFSLKNLDDKLFSRGDTTLRRGLMGNVVTLVVVLAGGLGSLLLFGSYRALEDVSERAIDQAVERTESDLETFFYPVEEKTRTIQGWGQGGELELGEQEVEALNRRFRPMIEENDHISAMSLAEMDGREYLAWEDGDDWVSRYTDGDDETEMATWTRWDEEGRKIEQWEEERDEDARLRPWYVGSMAREIGEVHWSEPFDFAMSDEPGITASLRYEAHGDGSVQVVALGVPLAALSEYTRAMAPTENGFNAVMTSDGELMGLPTTSRYADNGRAVQQDLLSTWEELGFDELGEAWEVWRDEGRPDEKIQGRSDEGRFWAGFRRFELDGDQLLVSTVVPRRDLMGAIDRQRNATIGLSLLAVVIAVLLSMYTSKKYRKRMKKVYDNAQELGQYRMGEKLGVGGMGEVYRAEHNMLKRPTALKLLKPDLYNRESIKRFEREVQLSCRLTHPNTVTIFDYGKTDEGLFYYAMELLEGVTLSELSDYAGPLSAGRVVYLMSQVCGALAEAHEIGLIHRDIKPSNIMVGNGAGLADRITVLDFGLVKDIKTPDDTQLTNQEYLHGSPGFMAPEVILGGGRRQSAGRYLRHGSRGIYVDMRQPTVSGRFSSGDHDGPGRKDTADAIGGPRPQGRSRSGGADHGVSGEEGRRSPGDDDRGSRATPEMRGGPQMDGTRGHWMVEGARKGGQSPPGGPRAR